MDVLKEVRHLQFDESTSDENNPSLKELENLFNLFIQDRIWELRSQDNHCVTTQSNSGSGDKLGSCNNQLFPVPDDSILRTNLEGTSFNKLMLKWIMAMKTLNSKDILPPPIIARFWVRFMSNLDYIHTDIETHFSVELDDVIRCWIKAFLSGLIIEEVIFKKGDLEHSIDVKHILLNDDHDKGPKVFTTLLESNKNNVLLKYASAWICCPLFLFFFETEKEIIKDYFNIQNDPWKQIVYNDIILVKWPE